MQDSIEIEKNVKVLEYSRFRWESELECYTKDGVMVSTDLVMDLGHIEFCCFMRENYLIELVPIKD